MKLTQQEMLAIWRRTHGHEPLRSDCSVEVFEGMDTQVSMLSEMRRRYLEILDTAPLRHLVMTDVASLLVAEPAGQGVWRIALPAAVRRLAALSLAGCTCEAVVTPRSDDSPFHRRLLNPYCRASRFAPMAVLEPDARTVTVFCRGLSAAVLASAKGVVDPGPDFYEFDESALALMAAP